MLDDSSYFEKKESRFREGKELAFSSSTAIPDALLRSRANNPMLAPQGYFPFEISKGPSASWDLGGENSKTGQFVLTGQEETEISPAFSLQTAGRGPGMGSWLWGCKREILRVRPWLLGSVYPPLVS